MNFSVELAELYRRDLTRLIQELEAFPNDGALWELAPAVQNSAGNLALHLEGNLREYVGRQLGGVAYLRKRETEFSAKGLTRDELMARLREVRELVTRVVAGLSEGELEATYPEQVFGAPIATRQFLISIYGHLNYHLGQIDYLRRVLTGTGAVRFVGL